MIEQNLETARTLLKKYYGYEGFRPGQEEVIRNVFAKKNSIVIMPTGGGKSICYQIPALVLRGVTVVISPLIALMKDQVDTLRTRGVPATFINSSIPLSEVQTRLAGLRSGAHKIVYIAPERFYSQMFLHTIRELSVALFAVDEAHCISEWGHDFRPSYLQLPKAVDALGRPPILALTATATPEVRQDIIAQLQLRDPQVFITGFDRPNLRYVVVKAPAGARNAKMLKLVEILRKVGGVSIVYCGTRRAVEEVTAQLRYYGMDAQGYHAGMSDTDRKRVQEDFMDERMRTVVATNAFGMGIDKSNVRAVVHYNMPSSIEAYYQEAGRAGRDGERSFCVLLYARADRSLQEYLIDQSYPLLDVVHAVYNLLYDIPRVPVGQSYDACIDLSTRMMAESLPVKTTDMGVSGALKILEEAGYVRRLTAADNLARCRVLTGAEDVLDRMGPQAAVSRNVVATLLQLYGDEILQHDVPLRLEELGRKTGLDPVMLQAVISDLKAREVIEYVPPIHGRGLVLLKRRVPTAYLKVDMEKSVRRRVRDIEKINKIENYAFTSECRRAYILKYFGDHTAASACGRCDNCKNPVVHAPDQPHVLAKAVLYGVAEMRGKFGAVMVSDVLRGRANKRVTGFRLESLSCFGKLQGWKDEAVREAIDRLIGDGYLAKSSGQFPTIGLTERGGEFLGQTALSDLVTPAPPAAAPVPAHGELKVATGEAADTTVLHPELLDTLRAVRRGFAERLGVPPFVICHDRVLLQMVQRLPRTRAEMLALSGMGEILYDRYGDAFRQAIVSFCDRNPEAAPADEPPPAAPAPPPRRHAGQTFLETHKLYQEGLDLNAIASRRGLSPRTIITHLTELIAAGQDVDISRFVSEAHQRRILAAVDEVGNQYLSPIRERVGKEISYEEIRLVLARRHYLSAGRAGAE